MESKSGNEYFLPRNGKLIAEQAGKFPVTPLEAWLVAVTLVLIVIGVALTLAALREHKREGKGTRARITALSLARSVELRFLKVEK
ncbi:MAG TPA: hypothetical protein VNO32_60050 [Candidatus Acidoferrum sp.]|nr:hypothetical protein [Candidatus Acidoferrum sp.]